MQYWWPGYEQGCSLRNINGSAHISPLIKTEGNGVIVLFGRVKAEGGQV